NVIKPVSFNTLVFGLISRSCLKRIIMEALEEAISVCGSVAALAEGIGVVRGAVSNWKKIGRIPAEHCPAIERETGVRCEQLRTDIDWSVLWRADGALKSGPAAAREHEHV